MYFVAGTQPREEESRRPAGREGSDQASDQASPEFSHGEQGHWEELTHNSDSAAGPARSAPLDCGAGQCSQVQGGAWVRAPRDGAESRAHSPGGPGIGMGTGGSDFSE